MGINCENPIGKQSFVLFLILCTLLFSFYYLDTICPKGDKSGDKVLSYAVVIDAGSTGSRLLAYEFYKTQNQYILERELYIAISPGLSSYSPVEGAETIKGLLEKAKDFVPKKMWSKTPLVVKATAGLRLLPPVDAKNLLNEVRDVCSRSGFLVEDNAVEILDGIDEGIYSWFTINHLLGGFDNNNTIAALDLGGGSTQVTFAPKKRNKILLPKNMYNVRVLNVKIDVFTSSYLNLGAEAVRHAIFTHDNSGDNQTLESICVNPVIKSAPFKYGTKLYQISGKNMSNSMNNHTIVDFKACVDLVKQKTLHLVHPKPDTLDQNEIAVFNYFFEAAVESGLIGKRLNSLFEISRLRGETTVGDLILKAKEVCTTKNFDKPFLCLDLTYISVLLNYGYGLKLNTKVHLYNVVNNHQISWALGCAYDLLVGISRTKI